MAVGLIRIPCFLFYCLGVCFPVLILSVSVLFDTLMISLIVYWHWRWMDMVLLLKISLFSFFLFFPLSPPSHACILSWCYERTSFFP